MSPADIHQQLITKFGSQITGAKLDAIDPWIEISPTAIGDVAKYLRDTPEFCFDALNDLCGVDYLEPDPKKAAKFTHAPHIEIVYHLYSYTHKHYLVLKVKLPRWKNDEVGSIPEVPSVAGVWAIADWHEREAFDLVGVRFLNHPNLRRILCPEDWEGHALRKDYEFPLEYHGVRGR